MEETTTQKGNNMGMIVLGIVLLLMVAGGVYFLSNANNTPEPNQTQAPIDDTGPANDEEAMIDDAEDATAEGNVVVEMDASNFEFSQTEIRVKQGDTVKITLNNVGGTHDWVIDEFDARTKILSNGESETIEFVADKTGEFEYYCSVGQHREMGMVGTLIVE